MWKTNGSSFHTGFLLFDTHFVLWTISGDVGILILKYGSGVSTVKESRKQFGRLECHNSTYRGYMECSLYEPRSVLSEYPNVQF